ncbi:archaeosortase/exosortase family protein [Thalassotalea sp. PS06]|uniref:archaeosortase/exosortase family protein n=1 Tax=Thalassotalea sp. PS06 TaxID=2594005 RepID=UPI0011649CC5|nr:archaeosortase/exosortase family protein [Thalassotalea sp. PS06]QDP02305.1 exosortase/archaeosortase family protein [Thalassotalea sp. PS06]
MELMSSLSRIKALVENDKNKLFSISLLLISYFILRLFFQQLPEAKSVFIFSTGYLVEWFYGFGSYDGEQWNFLIHSTSFVVNESCSGTTFFCLLMSFLIYKKHLQNISISWLLLAFPIVIFANTMRVLSAIYLFQTLSFFNADNLQEILHVAIGSITFLVAFLLITLKLDMQVNKNET